MDESRQDKVGSSSMATEGKLWIPALSPKEQEKLDRLQNNQIEDTIKQLSDRRYKVTEEYSNSGQLSKISREFPSKKTLWDWTQLLIVPLLIALLGIAFTGAQYLASLQIAQDNRTKDLQIAKDTQEEATLKAYLDDMTALLLDKKLGSQVAADKVASARAAVVARAKTLTALRRLTDAQRKARVLQFLYEAHLIGYLDYNSPSSASPIYTRIRSIINLGGADLSYANLTGANLDGADLSHTGLFGADLRVAHLFGADLRVADLREADLREAVLWDANLRVADLRGAFLWKADLFRADLSSADLSSADLSGANLTGANLFGTVLNNTILKGAQYNTKELLVMDSPGHIFDKILPTQWPKGFDPKAAGATEENT